MREDPKPGWCLKVLGSQARGGASLGVPSLLGVPIPGGPKPRGFQVQGGPNSGGVGRQTVESNESCNFLDNFSIEVYQKRSLEGLRLQSKKKLKRNLPRLLEWPEAWVSREVKKIPPKFPLPTQQPRPPHC